MGLRILHVTPYSETAWGYGGIPRVVGPLTRGLARRGHHVTVAATDAGDAHHRLLDPKPPPGVDLRLFPNLSNTLAYHLQFFLPRGLGTFLARHAGDYDVAHLHACHNLPGAMAAKWLNRAGVPYVLTTHGTAPRIERRRAAKWLFDTTMGRRVIPGAARVVAVSAAEARQLRDLGIADERIATVPNPVEVPSSPPRPESFRRRFDLGDEKLVLYLGKLTPRKRVETIVEAFARLEHNDPRLVIAGNDMGSEASVRRRVHALGLGSRTVFTGLLRGDERFDALAAADVVVYASRHEVFGLVPFEALVCGTPVVVADDSGCGELVNMLGGGRLVPLGDVEALSGAIAEILAMGMPTAEAAARVRERFAPEVVCRLHEDLYEALLEGRRTDPTRPTRPTGISFVVPVYNGERTLTAALDAILTLDPGCPREVIAVDDGSTDGSGAILERFAAQGIRVIAGEGRGAAAALNRGLREARHPLIAQVDQDVIVTPGWLEPLVTALDDPSVAAAQGHYVAAQGAALPARVAALDLARRYRRLPRYVDHVCTGTTLYRAAALAAVGGFDEDLGYAYDNDLSYRLGKAGHRLVLCRDAPSIHLWPETLGGYLGQQYGQGYGRLDLLARHRRRLGGDQVSGTRMMLHAPAMLAALLAGGGSAVMAFFGGPWKLAALIALLIAGGLFLERLAAGLAAWTTRRDGAALALAPFHMLRDLAWASAIVVWCGHRVTRRGARPRHSMPRRDG